MNPRWILPSLRRLARFIGSSSCSTRATWVPYFANSSAVATPEGVELHVNLQVAKRLGLPDSFTNELLLFAARQGLAVKAVE